MDLTILSLGILFLYERTVKLNLVEKVLGHAHKQLSDPCQEVVVECHVLRLGISYQETRWPIRSFD